VLYEVRGGGHTEPSLTEHNRRLYKRIVGPQNRDIEMAEEVWSFFKNRRRQAD
jgi:polyhydroxybutyrate depolymerase